MTVPGQHLPTQSNSKTNTNLERPFVYICSLRRTGSTVVAESLSDLPSAFMFREPKFGRNRFSLRSDDVTSFRKLGVDLEALRNEWQENKKTRPILTVLKEELFPQIADQVKQIGVKEIRNEGWRSYYEAFPDMRVVLTGRDPRDIYISLHQRLKAGLGSWKGDFTPERVAENLMEQFTIQREVSSQLDTFRIRYEDFCNDAQLVQQLRVFVESPLKKTGGIGQFLSEESGVRQAEHIVHGDTISDRRIGRWVTESDSKLIIDAQACFDLMTEYVKFWQYDASTGAMASFQS